MFLILFFLVALFHNLQGQPISSPHLPDANYDIFISRATGAENRLANLALCIAARSEWSIIRSCLVTILACTWKAIHPNIGAPEDTQRITFRRRVIVMVCALIAPEVMVLWAMKQYRGAERIMNKYNKDIYDKRISHKVAPKDSTCIPIPGFVKEWLWESPLSEVKDGLVRWSMVHGFFLQMGGLLLYKNGQPFEVLDYKHLKKRIDAGDIDIPLLTKAEINDRSKGNFIVKALVVLQTLGFVVQSIARLVEGLPLTELEVVTLAFAMLNGITYYLWRDKPQNVCVPIRIDLRQEKGQDEGQLKVQDLHETEPIENEESSSEGSDDDQPSNPHSGLYRTSLTKPRGSIMMSMSEETLIASNPSRQNRIQKGSTDSIESIQNLSNHLGCTERQEPRKIEEYNEWNGWVWFIVVQMPYRCGHFLCRPFSKMGGGAVLTKEKHRVPMFYAESEASDNVLALSAGIATAFGLIHFLAWSASFPSQPEKALWRTTALIITIEPVWFTIANLSWEPKIFKRWPWVETIVVGVAMVGLPLYIFARLALLVLAFLSLRDLPQAAHQTIEWTGVIPHL